MSGGTNRDQELPFGAEPPLLFDAIKKPSRIAGLFHSYRLRMLGCNSLD